VGTACKQPPRCGRRREQPAGPVGRCGLGQVSLGITHPGPYQGRDAVPSHGPSGGLPVAAPSMPAVAVLGPSTTASTCLRSRSAAAPVRQHSELCTLPNSRTVVASALSMSSVPGKKPQGASNEIRRWRRSRGLSGLLQSSCGTAVRCAVPASALLRSAVGAQGRVLLSAGGLAATRRNPWRTCFRFLVPRSFGTRPSGITSPQLGLNNP